MTTQKPQDRWRELFTNGRLDLNSFIAALMEATDLFEVSQQMLDGAMNERNKARCEITELKAKIAHLEEYIVKIESEDRNLLKFRKMTEDLYTAAVPVPQPKDLK